MTELLQKQLVALSKAPSKMLGRLMNPPPKIDVSDFVKLETIIKQHCGSVEKLRYMNENTSRMQVITRKNFKPFQATDLFPCPLKTPENQRVSDIFSGYEKRPMA